MMRFKYALTAILIFSAGLAFSQFQGKGAIHKIEIKTVKFVKENAGKLDKKDVAVKLKGYIVEQINSEDFWFQDATGKIKVEIEPEIMPQKAFNEKTELIIIGEVDSDWLEGTEIEIDRIEFVQTGKKTKQ